MIWNAIDCEMPNNSTPGLAVHSPMSPFIPGLEKITFGPKVERLYDAFLKNCTEIKGLQLPALHPGDRIDITGLAKTLSGAHPIYYVDKQSINGYPANHYAVVSHEEAGHWYLECKEPNAMRLGCYVSWENFEPYSANWIQDRDYIYLDFDITEESGLDSIPADADADVRVYSVAGALLYTGPLADAVLKPGIYVVKAGDKAHKIAVR